MKKRWTVCAFDLCLVVILEMFGPKSGFGQGYPVYVLDSTLCKISEFTLSHGRVDFPEARLPANIYGLSTFKRTLLPPRDAHETQHLFGRYVITLMGSGVFMSITIATASLIDNGTIHPSRDWVDDNFWLLVRPAMILGSSSISAFLFKRKGLRPFLTSLAINTAEVAAVSVAGKLLSEEYNLLLQLTTAFFLVPLTATLYQYISKRRENMKIGQVKIKLPAPGLQMINGKPLVGGRVFEINW